MEIKTVLVPNIGCNGCVNTIKLEVADIPGVVKVDGVVDAKQITVQWENPATWQAIEAKMREIDYAPQS
ncbi:MAG: cation transporter [Chloroflexi bacterium]|nr:cation transporter [Chloroflexota bacterium]